MFQFNQAGGRDKCYPKRKAGRFRKGLAKKSRPVVYILLHPSAIMLAARARTVHRLVRNFATVSDTAGIKVAAFDNNQPTSSVTVFVKAGSRFESKAGVANALKNFAFKVSCSV